MAQELTSSQMEINTKVITKKANQMESELTLGKVVPSTKANSKME